MTIEFGLLNEFLDTLREQLQKTAEMEPFIHMLRNPQATPLKKAAALVRLQKLAAGTKQYRAARKLRMAAKQQLAKFRATAHKPVSTESLRDAIVATRSLFEKRFFNVKQGINYHADRADKWLDKRDAYAKKRYDPDIDPDTKEKLKRLQMKAHYLAALHTVRSASYARMRKD